MLPGYLNRIEKMGVIKRTVIDHALHLRREQQRQLAYNRKRIIDAGFPIRGIRNDSYRDKVVDQLREYVRTNDVIPAFEYLTIKGDLESFERNYIPFTRLYRGKRDVPLDEFKQDWSQFLLNK
jgi:hypothetical protein